MAAQKAGLTVIPALVRDVADRDSLEQAIVENLHREELNPLEEAAAYLRLIDQFGLTQQELAARVGRSRPTVANPLRLLDLPGDVDSSVAISPAGTLVFGCDDGHLRAYGAPAAEAGREPPGTPEEGDASSAG